MGVALLKAHLDIRHEGNVGTENRTRMTFDENSIAHLMSILTDLYSDPELAVIREYATNAYDSHRAAGNPAPVEVTLPTALRAMFTVKDFGTGLSVSDITDRLSKYGYSSKRDTDDEVGMLGLGFKSALTYTGSFTMYAVQNGVKTTVLITREDDGAGTVQVIDTEGTDEPNGVEVQIPVKWVDSFNLKAKKFYSFWEPGTVLVNGEPVVSVFDHPEAMLLDPDVVLVPSSVCAEDRIVMGNIAYPVGQRITQGITQGMVKVRAVVRVPIGAINFTPSREALHMTSRTKEVIEDVKQFISDRLAQVAQADIDAAPTPREAMRRALRWKQVNRRNYTYRGVAIPHSFPTNDSDRTFKWRTNQAWESVKKVNRYLRLDEMVDAIHIVGYKNITFTKTAKDKIKVWLDQHGIDTTDEDFAVLMYPERIGGDWLNDLIVFDWEDIKAIKLKDTQRSTIRQRKPAKKAAVLMNGVFVTDDVPTDKPILFLRPKDRDVYTHGSYDLWDAFGQTHTVVMVYAAYEKRFLADHPQAEHVSDMIAGFTKKFIEGLSPHVAYAILNTSTSDMSGLVNLNPGKIDDAALAADVKALKHAYSTATASRKKWDALKSLMSLFDMRAPSLPSATPVRQAIRAWYGTYPLLEYAANTSGVRDKEHFTEYVNAVYAARQVQSKAS